MSHEPIQPKPGVKERNDQQYAAGRWAYLGQHPREVPRYGVVAGYLRFAAPEDGSVLDLGCGEGVLFRYLSEHQKQTYVGVDISEVATRRARENGIPEAHCDAIERFTPSRYFDCIVFNEVLYYTADALAVVQRYVPFLQPGGSMIVSWYRGDQKPVALWARLREAGFQVVDRTTLTSETKNLTWEIGLIRPPAGSPSPSTTTL